MNAISKDGLLAFLRKRGQKNVVFRVEDVLQLDGATVGRFYEAYWNRHRTVEDLEGKLGLDVKVARVVFDKPLQIDLALERPEIIVFERLENIDRHPCILVSLVQRNLLGLALVSEKLAD